MSSHPYPLARGRIIRIPLRAGGVEGGFVGSIEGEIFLQAVREIGVREERHAVSDGIGPAFGDGLLGLRTVEGVARADLAALGRTEAAEPLAGLIADGFLAVDADRVRATAAGRPVLDGVLRALRV